MDDELDRAARKHRLQQRSGALRVRVDGGLDGFVVIFYGFL